MGAVLSETTTAPSGGRGISAADGSTFAPALRLLPAGVRGDVESLYLLLRTLDDLVDDDDPRASSRVQAVELWAQGRRRAHETPETLALERLVKRHPLLPRARLLEFCAGMRHDLEGGKIDTDADFARYCMQAGGSVGVVLTSLLGTIDEQGDGCPQRGAAAISGSSVREAATISGSSVRGAAAISGSSAREAAEAGMAALGRAMQVTNILRDIDEDLSHGRVYIPLSAIKRHGFPAPGEREQLLREGIAKADALYEQGSVAIPLLRHGRAAMALASDLYQEILREIERDGFGARPGRAVVSTERAEELIAKHEASEQASALVESTTNRRGGAGR